MLPAACHHCGERIDETEFLLCSACWQAVAACANGDACPRCGRDVSVYALGPMGCPLCQAEVVIWDEIIRCTVYADVVQAMILSFKYGKTELSQVFGFWLQQKLAAHSFGHPVDLWVPVPLHWTRRLQRSFNQAEILAQLCRRPGTRVGRVLRRVRRTSIQPIVATSAARARNVKGAFALSNRVDVTGATVCLVDDVKTSGATLNECARVLKASGAAHVYALVLAVAGQRPA